MGYISFLPKTYIHTFLPRNTLGYCTAQKYCTETVINASSSSRNLIIAISTDNVVSVCVEVVCQKQQIHYIRLHFQDFYIANLFMILVGANLVTIFKKGDWENCSNYRGISLLSIASKIFARILLHRLLTLAKDVLPGSQCDFRPTRGTVDMIFCARQLQEKSQEQQQPLMFIFWDLKKAFDKVPRPVMWAVLARFGCPEDFITLIRGLHDDMVGRVW